MMVVGAMIYLQAVWNYRCSTKEIKERLSVKPGYKILQHVRFIFRQTLWYCKIARDFMGRRVGMEPNPRRHQIMKSYKHCYVTSREWLKIVVGEVWIRNGDEADNLARKGHLLVEGTWQEVRMTLLRSMYSSCG